ncbi:uncharacterized protein LOC105396524 [Plutella xylostella]|uniref:uncharacterized protein LOC105396524 n=1 Tax=Plutella xylostella TaxID=51655 RepID=UPI002032DCB1|nr:uncharacterized protein LOC105396524 [Plutella xylostella]
MDDTDENCVGSHSTTPSKAGVKPKRRSLIERELETTLTARVTSPVTTGEAAGSTSRYGRSRRLKTDPEPIKIEITTPNTSPVRKTQAPGSIETKPNETSTDSKKIDITIETIQTNNISLSRFGSEGSASKSPMNKNKVYVKKDLIQNQVKKETFSPTENMPSSAKKARPSNKTHLNLVLERSMEENGFNKPDQNDKKKQNGFPETLSVVKTLNFDGGIKVKKEEYKKEAPLSKSEIFDREAKCVYQVGDLAWARVGTYPFWPCIVTRDPYSDTFVKKKLFGRVERDVIHVTFFGDNGRRGWIVDNMLRKFSGLQEFEDTRSHFTPESKRKDPRYYAAFFVSDKKRSKWNISVQEAETIQKEPKRLRIDALYDLIHKIRGTKMTPKRQRSNKVTRTDSDVSLSESLYDTLFSEDDTKEDPDNSMRRLRKTSLDVSEVVTACLDNMAAKTGISMIQKQSHMDIWLQKAKSKTPEKPPTKLFTPIKNIIKDISRHTSKKAKKTISKENTPQKNYNLRRSFANSSDIDNLSSIRIMTALQMHEHDYSKSAKEEITVPENDSTKKETETENKDKSFSDVGSITRVETLTDIFDHSNTIKESTLDIEMTVATDDIVVSDSVNNIKSEESTDNLADYKQTPMDVDPVDSSKDIAKDFAADEENKEADNDLNIKIEELEGSHLTEDKDSEEKSLASKKKTRKYNLRLRHSFQDISDNNEQVNKVEESDINSKLLSDQEPTLSELVTKESKEETGYINFNGDLNHETNKNQTEPTLNGTYHSESLDIISKETIVEPVNTTVDNDKIYQSDASVKEFQVNGIDINGTEIPLQEKTTTVQSEKNDSEPAEEKNDNNPEGDVKKDIAASKTNKDVDYQISEESEKLPECNGYSSPTYTQDFDDNDVMNEQIGEECESVIRVSKVTGDLIDVNPSPTFTEDFDIIIEPQADKESVCTSSIEKDSTSHTEPECESKDGNEHNLYVNNEIVKEDTYNLVNNKTDITEAPKDLEIEQTIPIPTNLDPDFESNVCNEQSISENSIIVKECDNDNIVNNQTDFTESTYQNSTIGGTIAIDSHKEPEVEIKQCNEERQTVNNEIMNEDNTDNLMNTETEKIVHTHNTSTSEEAMDTTESNAIGMSPTFTEGFDSDAEFTKPTEESNIHVTEKVDSNIEHPSESNGSLSPTFTQDFEGKLYDVEDNVMPVKTLIELASDNNSVAENTSSEISESFRKLDDDFTSYINDVTCSIDKPNKETMPDVLESGSTVNKTETGVDKNNVTIVNGDAQDNESNSVKDTFLDNQTEHYDEYEHLKITEVNDLKSDTMSIDSTIEDNLPLAAISQQKCKESGDKRSLNNTNERSPKSKTKKKIKISSEVKKAKCEPEFLKYLELRRDAIMDEYPEFTDDEIVSYLYKTWVYEEDLKSDSVKNDDIEQSNLVKGLSNGTSHKTRKIRIKRKENKESWVIEKVTDSEFSSQTVTPEPVSNDSDSEDDIAIAKIASPAKVNGIKESVPCITKKISSKSTIDSKHKSDTEDYDESIAKIESNRPKKKAKVKMDIDKHVSKSDLNAAMEDPEFVKYLELRQDALFDENPHVSVDDITLYLYKTWLYEEEKKSETVKSDEIEQSNLIKGLGNETSVQPKKVKKHLKIEKEYERNIEEIIPKYKPKRKVAKAYYNENYMDLEEELEIFEIFKFKNKSKSKTPTDGSSLNSEPISDQVPANNEEQSVPTSEEVDTVAQPEDADMETWYDEEEFFFSELTRIKPNVFKGLVRERVCEICEKTGNLVKCRGACAGMFHVECTKKEVEEVLAAQQATKGRKKKKPRGRKPKSLDDSESQSDEKSQTEDQNDNVDNIVIDAATLETELEAKMKDMLEQENDVEYESSNSDDELKWDKTVAGKCEIVEVKLKVKKEDKTDYSDFKCNDCQKCDIPLCFVCKAPVSPKNGVETRQKCHLQHCHKFYHLECLEFWPQTQFNSGEPSRSNKKISEHYEAITCPRHVCHTCVSDDPRGCKTRFSGDKLARCVRCPATYHSFNKCLPAGSTILSASHIICPRHYEHRPGKVPCHVNTGWCFICALGGTLICCEYCPTSFHAECLHIAPPEGNYMCEDCETGRLPLYGEMVWVKLGHYRWWPGIILHPCEIPDNIMAVKHSQGEFVVRFFGQYDHYWVNRGRVFPFQEGDTGKISSQKSKIDEAFTKAMEHAHKACEILKTAPPNEEELAEIQSSYLPPHYVKLKVNKPCSTAALKRTDDEESSLTSCECDPRDVAPCSVYSHCLNRSVSELQKLKVNKPCSTAALKRTDDEESSLTSCECDPRDVAPCSVYSHCLNSRQLQKLKVNKPCSTAALKRTDDEESSLTSCECDPRDVAPCSVYSHCLNRMLLTECGPTCRAGERCQNRSFEKRVYPKMAPYRTPHRGWGLRTLEEIKQGQFVIEYVGELIDIEEFKRRMKRQHHVRDENYYYLTLDKDRMIDAGPKGNVARFMNHSCEPNCETQKWTVLGDVRVGLFALYDIPANTELTFNYNLECAGIDKKRCMCGAKRCSGYIGAKPKQEEAQPKKSMNINPKTGKRTYNKKRKPAEESPSANKPKVPKPRKERTKPKELTEIEKDLLIIKNATNGLMSSDSECSGRLSSLDREEKTAKEGQKALKRKRVSFSTEEIVLHNGDVEAPSVKKMKLDEEVGD